MDNKYFSFLSEDEFWLMLHALLRDALVLSLIAFAGLMTLEGLMPGFVSMHLSLAKLLFAIALLFFASIAIGHMPAVTKAMTSHIPAVAKAMASQRKNITLSSSDDSNWLFAILLLWSSLLTINSLIKFPLYAIVIIFILTALIGKLLHDEFFTK